MALDGTGLSALPLIQDDLPFEDYHEILAAAREQAPVARNQHGRFLALRHDHMAKLTAPATTRQPGLELMAYRGIAEGPVYEMYENAMLFANGAAHQRLRGPLARTFAFSLIEGMRDFVAEEVDKIVSARIGAGRFDFAEEVAAAVPSRIISEILGLPEEDRARFVKWVALSAKGFQMLDADEHAEVERALQNMLDLVQGLVDGRRAAPNDDFMTKYVREADEAGDLNASQIRAQIVLTILAGTDTTRLSICGALKNLLLNPEQWKAVCDDPDGMKKAAVQEGLRFEPPVASFMRMTLEEIDLDGIVIPKGAFAAPSVLAANRDPDVYADPQRFDIHRTDHPRWHPSFGAGEHRCLGEALGRIEIEETIAAIARTAPGVRLEGGVPKLYGLLAVRDIDRMEVDFG